MVISKIVLIKKKTNWKVKTKFSSCQALVRLFVCLCLWCAILFFSHRGQHLVQTPVQISKGNASFKCSPKSSQCAITGDLLVQVGSPQVQGICVHSVLIFNCCPFHHNSAKIHLLSSWNLKKKKPPGFCQNHLWCLVRSYCFPSFQDQLPSRNQMLPKWPKPVENIHGHVWEMYNIHIHTYIGIVLWYRFWVLRNSLKQG